MPSFMRMLAYGNEAELFGFERLNAVEAQAQRVFKHAADESLPLQTFHPGQMVGECVRETA